MIMKKEIKNIMELVKENLIEHINHTIHKCTPNDCMPIMDILKVYNDYQENEKDGIDYIFNMNNNEDLICIIKGGCTAYEIGMAFISNTNKRNNTSFFFYGINHPKIEMLNLLEIYNILILYREEIAMYILKYPNRYMGLYNKFIANHLYEE